jgi:6-pyruvoyltetrahydropterin/6-carboxytetrahydropterin synthase
MTVLHKIFRFCAAHRYYNPELSPDENEAAFGEDLRLHGHNYTLTVSVTGEIDPRTGFLVDLGRLKAVVQERVIAVLDHRHIDAEVEWFRHRQPSTENLVRFIWEQIAAGDPGCRLLRIRLQETDTIYTDHYGPGGGPALAATPGD